MAIQPEKLIEKFQLALNEKWGYIWGRAGIVWTEKLQQEKINYMVAKYGTNWKNTGKAQEDNYYTAAMYGSKWIGRRVADCSGLFSWAFKQLGGYMYHGSNTMYNKYCTSKGALKKGVRADGKTLLPGTAVFTGTDGKRGHVGLYIGNGRVIEAQGTISGVVQSKVSLSKWTWWGEMKGVNYTRTSEAATKTTQVTSTAENSKTESETRISTSPTEHKTLRRGAKGDEVRELQTLLAKDGSSLAIDGIFGSGTLSAVKAFQRRHGLVVDGIVGPKTWAALLALS